MFDNVRNSEYNDQRRRLFQMNMIWKSASKFLQELSGAFSAHCTLHSKQCQTRLTCLAGVMARVVTVLVLVAAVRGVTVSREGGYEDLVISLDPDIGQQSCGHTLASIKVGAVSSEHLLKLGLSSKPLYKRAIAPGNPRVYQQLIAHLI